MASAEYDAMVLLTYVLPSHVDHRAYDAWLRQTDNPFFNAIPGIAHYSNWQVVAPPPAKISFAHFDFVGLESAEALKGIWFNRELDEFRDGWVAKWGYGDTGPAATANGFGLFMTRRRVGMRSFGSFARCAFDGDLAGTAMWEVESVLRKHWALGQPPEGEHWRLPADRSTRGRSLGVAFFDEAPGHEGPASFVGRCIAAPGL